MRIDIPHSPSKLAFKNHLKKRMGFYMMSKSCGGKTMKKTRWKIIFWIGPIIILTSGFYGCADLFTTQTVQERGTEVQPPVSTSYRFEDIPLPPEMTLNWKESFVYESQEIRTGFLVYEGKGEIGKLSNFFKQQMPNQQWRLLSGFELHNVMLSFIKEGWCSIIYILPQEGEAKRIEIRFGPIEKKSFSPSKN
jgi:hypothetical protein